MSGDYMQGNRDNATIVPFSDDESDKDKVVDELDEDSPDASPEERLNRKQRRIQRLRTMATEGKQSKEELERLKTEQATLKTELATLRGYVAAQPQQRAANDDGKDPYEKRLDAVYDRQSEAYTSAQAEIAAGTFTTERQKHYERVARDIESEKTRIHTERTVESTRHQSRTEQAQQVWVQKYPEVYRDPNAFRYAQATWNQRIALGEAQTNELADEVLNQTMTQFRLGKKAAPSASDRARMSGLPSAGGGGAGPRPAGIAMDPTLRRMAIAAHSDLPEDEAIKKWTNTTGKKLRAKKVL
jgi:hypothetical protein